MTPYRDRREAGYYDDPAQAEPAKSEPKPAAKLPAKTAAAAPKAKGKS